MKYTYSIQNIMFTYHEGLDYESRVWIMNPGFHRVDERGREGGGGGGEGRIRIPFPLPPSINFFSRNNQLNYSNNLITQIVTVAGKLQHDF